jgi:hypothetical protein
MTQHPIRVLEDGTRVYSNGTRYKPKPLAERKYKVRKPADPRAVRWGGKWWVEPEVVDENKRIMPLTRPDREAFDHYMEEKLRCRCEVCKRREGREWRDKAIAAVKSGATAAPQ